MDFDSIWKRFAARSYGWPALRRRHLRANPTCAACGAGDELEVHHIEPVAVNPQRELDPDNLITLCGQPRDCHRWLGHAGDYLAWRPDVRRLAAEILAAEVRHQARDGRYSMERLIQLHNDARSKSWWSLKPLTRDDKLMAYAQAWADTMAKRNRMVHSSMRDIMRLGYSRAAENIAWNQQSEEAVMSAWLWSPGHRMNIMSSASNVIGVGVSDAGSGPYWCACFGRLP